MSTGDLINKSLVLCEDKVSIMVNKPGVNGPKNANMVLSMKCLIEITRTVDSMTKSMVLFDMCLEMVYKPGVN